MRVFRSDKFIMRGTGVGQKKHESELNFRYQSDLYRRRGAGIGSIFSSIYSTVVPLIKSALRIGSRVVKSPVGRSVVNSAKKTAMKAGLNVVNDALRGENVVQSTKRELKKAKGVLARNVARKVLRAHPAPPPAKKSKKRGRKRGRGRTGRRSTAKKHPRSDLFDR